MQEFTGSDYVRIDLANQFGLDRLNWNDRLFWVRNNRPDMHTLVATAKNKLAFTKALRALESAENGESTNFIMGMDATASGIQLMAAMSGCHTSAETVNLINTGNREDVYEAVSKHMSLQTTRDDVKHPIMTFFYGSQAVPKRVFGEGEHLEAFYDTLKERLPGPYGLMKLFQSHWNPTAEKYEWAMPDGHVVHVPVTVKEDHGLEIDETEPHTRFTYRAQVVRPQPEGRSLAANIVHSVDGWVCREMIKRAKTKGFLISTIHDCFYAHPNHMNMVRQLYREVVAEVADMNLVEMILSQIAGRRITYFKISSDLGKKIRESEYALS